MNKFDGMTIEQGLRSKPIIKTQDLVELLGRTARTFYRWQNHELYENPMPRPFSESRGAGNIYDAGEILNWYQSLPLRKREKR